MHPRILSKRRLRAEKKIQNSVIAIAEALDIEEAEIKEHLDTFARGHRDPKYESLFRLEGVAGVLSVLESKSRELAEASEILVNKAERLSDDVEGMAIPLDINTATREELITLDDIGPAIVDRIIDERPYDAVEDLIRVNGIGQATLEQIAPMLTVKGDHPEAVVRRKAEEIRAAIGDVKAEQ